MLYLFLANTDAGQAAGNDHLVRVAGRLATRRPDVSGVLEVPVEDARV
jgi:hypothetical protein